MRFVSTRDPEQLVSLSTALRAGLAPDGGLYIPTNWPIVPIPRTPPPSLEEAAYLFLDPFFEEDELKAHLPKICREAFNFPCPIVPVADDNRILELFHGPTAAFKDYGARFLAACLSRLPPSPGELSTPRTILVATSGDTGGAVAAAFANRSGHRVWILFPEDGVSPLQEAQLTGWGDRVLAFAINGDFDDCQRLVKEAFLDEALKHQYRLTSANSINIGRLLPQAAYIWSAALDHYYRFKEPIRLIIPTGNLGHGLAALWAKTIGAPISDVVFALNANRAVLDYITTGSAGSRSTIKTIANAMDVSIPSNLERLKQLPAFTTTNSELKAFSFSDEHILDGIKRAESDWGAIVCPHTACGFLAREQLNSTGWTIAATAHPAKFESVVNPMLSSPVVLPSSLKEILQQKQRKMNLDPSLDRLRSVVEDYN